MPEKTESTDPVKPSVRVAPADDHHGQRLVHAWPTDASACRLLQHALADHVELSPPADRIRRIAGVDIGFPSRGHETRAAVAVLDADSLACEYSARCTTPTRMPYIPGLLSFRELPAVVSALAALPITPDLLMVDGHGIAHPRGIGTASHLGLVTGLPSIGVAKRRLTGNHQTPTVPGDSEPLSQETQQIGSVLKTRQRAGPVFVSPGHRMDQDSALAQVRRMLAGYRLPEPTRLADALTRDP